MIPGAPGSETPFTFTVGDAICNWYQIEGNVRSKCGSLAKMGYPFADLPPAMAQLLLPTPVSISLVWIPSVICARKPVDGFGTGSGLKSHLVPAGIMGSS